ncbi:hypothetical protein GQ600_21087 [Phytophthora cactorum]|nr:hypothetical protein GQ600_21087 [Phytophthora cactorum]
MTVKRRPPHRSSVTRLAGKDIAGVSRVVAKSELEQIKQRSVILTDAAAQQLKSEREAQQAVSRHASEERKRRMMEKEIEVRARREQSAMEMELEAERKALLTGNEMINNQHLESLQRKDAEVEAHAKRMEARQVLEEQISERHKQSIREEEAKDIEAQKILKIYKQYEVEEQRKLEQHHKRQKETMRQVAQTNEQIKHMKEQMVIRDKKEEMAAAAYLRRKALEEEAKLQEEARIRKSKELRTAKLRAQQEKAHDKQAIQDEFRARKRTRRLKRTRD